MSAAHRLHVTTSRGLEAILAPFLAGDLPHVQSIRLGTKALGFWPQRFVTDRDADELVALKTIASERSEPRNLVVVERDPSLCSG